MSREYINEEVTVTNVGFRKNLGIYPKKIEFRGSSYSFIDAGLRCIVKHGGRIAEIITMSDGRADYCLRSENNGSSWTLVSIGA